MCPEQPETCLAAVSSDEIRPRRRPRARPRRQAEYDDENEDESVSQVVVPQSGMGKLL